MPSDSGPGGERPRVLPGQTAHAPVGAPRLPGPGSLARGAGGAPSPGVGHTGRGERESGERAPAGQRPALRRRAASVAQ